MHVCMHNSEIKSNPRGEISKGEKKEMTGWDISTNQMDKRKIDEDGMSRMGLKNGRNRCNIVQENV